MTGPTTLRTDLDVARAFGDAYARGDLEGLGGLLHPRVRERELTPHAYFDQNGPEAVVQEVAQFLAPFGTPETLVNEVEPFGPLFRWTVRWRVTLGAVTRLIEWHAYLGVADGRIRSIDGVCSGLVPDSTA